MITINSGFRLVCRTLSEGNFFFLCPDGMIEYAPLIKHVLEKVNAFDPTYVHRRTPYHQDTLTLRSALTPELYLDLLDFLETEGSFYVEFATNGDPRQFPILITRYPAAPDDLNEYTAEVVIEAESRYYSPLGYIDFDSILQIDDEEIVV